MGLEPFHISQYTTNLELGIQQKDSRFSKAVMHGMHMGKMAQVISTIGSVEMNKITGRLQPMVKSEAPFDSRWVKPADYDNTQYEDRLDRLRTIIDPKSKFVEVAVAALNRARDSEIISAIFGTALTGVEGTTNTPYVATADNTVAANVRDDGVAGNTGLNVQKLIDVRRKFKELDIDLDYEEIWMAITAEQEANLLADAKVVNRDFNPQSVLVNGKLPGYMGINFIHSEKLPLDSAGIRKNPAWLKSGIYLGEWKEKEVDITQRKDMRGLPWQIYLLASFGATRTDEKKVVQVLNAEI